MIQVAQTCKHFSHLAANVFRWQYADKLFEIGNCYEESGDTITTTRSQVLVKNLEAAASLLRLFGHLIKRLGIAFDYIDLNNRKVISEHIEKYCSESLIEIHLNGFDENVMPIFENPFQNIEIVTITGHLALPNGNLVFPAMRMNELFPKLRRLSVSNVDVYDPRVLAMVFPKIEIFEISLMRAYADQSPLVSMANFKMAVRNLFKRNSHIKSVTFNECDSLKYLNLASEFLLNLEELNARFVALDNYNGETIHFPNVKTFFFVSWHSLDISSKVSFDQIEELSMECLARECVAFIVQNQNVRKLDLVTNALSRDDLLEIGEKLPNLTDLTLKSDSGITAGSIIEFISMSKNLERMKVEFLSQADYETLEKNLKLKWTMNQELFHIFLEKILEN